MKIAHPSTTSTTTSTETTPKTQTITTATITETATMPKKLFILSISIHVLVNSLPHMISRQRFWHSLHVVFL